jgi:transposase
VTIKNQMGPAHAQRTGRTGRRASGYPGDLTGARWQVIAPHLPPDRPGRRGRPRIWPVRRIIDALRKLARIAAVRDAEPTAASVHDRQGARPLLWNLHRACRHIRLAWADAGYAGKLTAWAATLEMTPQIISKRDPHAFEVLPRRWVIERTSARISKHRRTVRDYEHLPASHIAMILRAMITLMALRLAQTDDFPDAH